MNSSADTEKIKTDTIAAVSTASGQAGIGIVRVSGPEAFSVADRVYRSPGGKKKLSLQPGNTIHYGYIYDGDELIDEVLISIMRAPKSFTAEDTVEINCHGGVYAVNRILETVIRNGARPAEPGEFTKRAFLNGRLDLSQAEAVMDVIQAKNAYALKSSVSQLKGAVLERIRTLREELIYDIAFIEAALDDPEHISLDDYPAELEEKNSRWLREIQKLIDSFQNGKRLTEGICTAIVGKPNAGKSTLLNALVGEERAIVTDIAGTTRDVLQETISIQGMTLNLLDTAGIRSTEDIVEQIGVEKAREAVEKADLVLYVADSSSPLDESDEEILSLLDEKTAIILLNKMDLDHKITEADFMKKTDHPIVSISAKKEQGIDELAQKIKDLFFAGNISFNDEVYITNIRHKNLLHEARESLLQVKASIEAGMPEDFYSIDLMNAYEKLGKIIGESVGEDLVNEIFGKFCMGK